MSGATETKPDTRVRVAGHPLPWKLAVDQASGELIAVLDSDERPIVNHLHEHRDAGGNLIVPDSFYRGLVDFLNRYHGDDWFVRAHEAVKAGYVSCEEAEAMFGLKPGCSHELPPGTEIQVIPHPHVEALESALVTAVSALEKATGDATRNGDEEDAILAGLKETLTNLGLADRLPGNPAEAEEAVT